ncbi:hypothetical protein EDD18DRAFT_1313295 [Armillaria luteobubalina]|uniref:Uncharacterized protein n=1 Tax=Armillaria luteobubalina TaxID=153913 RepID=A0AA39P0J4_9AGAR|nr:hypothetical protein EDD18DRAFT_1313295 [Armillaria luteobubalina]
MFGESESESPRVPSPWDSLISTLHHLRPIWPFTQLKWRLLEGGGQAYYELGVADSGTLVGLPRVDLEQTLETLEMMAGEIGASVIVVKEIEVPAALATLAILEDSSGGVARRGRKTEFRVGSEETELSTTDAEEPGEVSSSQTQVSIDLEISSVFKPRPFRTRVPRNNRGAKKKAKHHLHDVLTSSSAPSLISTDEQRKATKGLNRRQARDRRREERRNAFDGVRVECNRATPKCRSDPRRSNRIRRRRQNRRRERTTKQTHPTPFSTCRFDRQLVSAEPPTLTVDEDIPSISLVEPDNEEVTDDDDVFATPSPSVPYTSVVLAGAEEGKDQPRLIVEALVVRKLSIEEAFLDFGGFSLS